MIRKHKTLIIILLFVFGAYLRLATVEWNNLHYPDSTRYLTLAKEVRNGTYFKADLDLMGGFYDSRRLAPLYSLLISVGGKEATSIQHFAIFLSFILSLLTMLQVYFLAKYLFSEDTAMVALVLIAFHPFTILYSSQILTEPLFTFLYLSCVSLSIAALANPSMKMFFASGSVASLLFLTREPGLSAIGIILLTIAVGGYYFKKWTIQQIAKSCAVTLLAFLLFTTPFWLQLRLRTGKWLLSGRTAKVSLGQYLNRIKKPNQSYESYVADKKLAATKSLTLVSMTSKLLSKLQQNVPSYFGAFVKNLGLVTFSFLLLALVHLMLSNKKRNLGALILVTWILQLILLYALATSFMVDSRYIYPLMPLGVILAAQGVVASINLSKPLTKQYSVLAATVMGFFFLCFYIPDTITIIVKTTSPRFSYCSGTKEIAQAALAQKCIKPGSMFLARKFFLPYHAKGNFFFSPPELRFIPATVDDVNAALHRYDIDYVCVDSMTSRVLCPKLLELSLGMESLSCGKIAFSKIIPDLDNNGRVFTIIDTSSKESEPASLHKANEFIKKGALPQALIVYNRLLHTNPKNSAALEGKAAILLRYFDLIYNPTCPTLITLPKLVPTIVDTLEQIVSVKVDCRKSIELLKHFKNVFKIECDVIKKSIPEKWPALKNHLAQNDKKMHRRRQT